MHAASFGYLLAYPFVAALVGALASRGGDRTVLRTTATMALGSLVIYAFGLPWLMATLHVGLARGLALGVTPFLAGDAARSRWQPGCCPPPGGSPDAADAGEHPRAQRSRAGAS